MWLGNAVTSSTLLADPPSNETIDVFYIKIVSVMNMLLIYLFASLTLGKGHKNYLALVLKLCYHYDILRNRLKYYTERRIK